MQSRPWLFRLLKTALILFVLLNVLVAFHAWRFTHFTASDSAKTDAQKLTLSGKVKAALFGVNNPRPVNSRLPQRPYKVVSIQSEDLLQGWEMWAGAPKGTVILFHGYGGDKSKMLDKAEEFLKLGYNTLVIDFAGSGGSEGSGTTVGFHEAIDVKACYDYVLAQKEQTIILFGTSMGAAAVLKAIKDYHPAVKAIIIECPFGTMYETASVRFKMMHFPSFPMAGLLVFWGGLENGFWAFGHNPADYARSVKVPALLLYGEKDDRVTRKETDDIFKNLGGYKQLRTYPEAGHENYLNKYRNRWVADISGFLDESLKRQ